VTAAGEGLEVRRARVASEGITGDRLDAMSVGLLLCIDQATVYQWVKEGKLLAPDREGRRMLWRRSDIERLACGARNAPTAL
jgi:predicted site-specific integrase-resolvase